jgi:signal transduction histidine kinase
MDDLRREVAELRASRGRVLAAADDRRHSIERELHDGAMQQLVALSVNLQLARRLVSANPSGTAELLDEMLENVHEALDELRQLAWRVYPSLLFGAGIADALRTAASLLEIPTRVEVVAPGRLVPQLEVSIYFCCVELLQLAAGGESRAVVHVGGGERMLFELTIEHADVEEWSARDLSSVRDRLAAIGGRLAVEATPASGVRVSAAVSHLGEVVDDGFHTLVDGRLPAEPELQEDRVDHLLD